MPVPNPANMNFLVRPVAPIALATPLYNARARNMEQGTSSEPAAVPGIFRVSCLTLIRLCQGSRRSKQLLMRRLYKPLIRFTLLEF